VVLDDPEQHKINDHHHKRNDPRNRSQHSPNQSTTHPMSQRSQESQESDTARDGVQDHGIREAVSGMHSSTAIRRAIDGFHDLRRLVPNVFGGAVIMNTISERAERDGRAVRKCDFQNGDVVYYWRGDGRHQEEACCY